MPNRLTQFWQELKRRKVTRVITVYAAAAFVIIELVDIVAPNLGLPTWTFNFVLILLLVGFVITVIVSWIYDIHPEDGIVKTEPVHKVKPEDIPKSSNSWKIASYISFAVIVVMVCILLYPKIFKHDKLSELRDDKGMISLAVLPFDNLTGDSSLYFWQNGISEYLINQLGNSEELAVSSSQVVSDVLEGTRQVNAASLSPDIARKAAIKINASTYITGNFIGKENDITIMLNLVNTESGDLIWTTHVNGNLGDFYRNVLDHLSDTIKNYIEIKALEEQVEADLSNAYPNSAEAYRHYIEGLNALIDENYERAIESLTSAYEIDTTFTLAAFYLAFAYDFNSQIGEEMVHWINKAHELKKNLPPVYHPWLDIWYACFVTKNLDDIRRNSDTMFETALHSRILWFDLATTYMNVMRDYKKGIRAFQKIEELNEQWEDEWRYDRYYNEYSMILLYAGKPEEVHNVIKKGMEVNPDNTDLLVYRGAAFVMSGDSAALNRTIEEYWTLVKEKGMTDDYCEHEIGNMYLYGKDTLSAIEHFRRAYDLNPERYTSLEWMLYCQIHSDLNIEECLRMARLGFKQWPERIYLEWAVGLSLHKLGRHKEALAILREADEKLPVYDYELKRDIRTVKRALAFQDQ